VNDHDVTAVQGFRQLLNGIDCVEQSIRFAATRDDGNVMASKPKETRMGP
jgi:hypothetical protein